VTTLRLLVGAEISEAARNALARIADCRFERTPGGPAAGDGFDAVIADPALAGELLAGAARAAVLVALTADPATAELVDWLRRGAQDVLVPARTAPEDIVLRVSMAVERRRIADEARRASGLDLASGLPDERQLIEHTSHLIALRLREPAPLALLVLRIEGMLSTQARHGRDAAGVLRRKLAVRLRSAVRASDVVASLGDDRFAVLLASVQAAADAERVADKLRSRLAAPFPVGGQWLAVAVAIGIAQHPADGEQPAQLVARAAGLAASAPARGRAGFANFGESGAASAAND